MTEGDEISSRWMRGFYIFWQIILLLSFGLAIYDAAKSDPTLLASWRGVVMGLLIFGFLMVYYVLESNERRCRPWPIPYRKILLYLCIQLILMIMLLHIHSSFVGPVFALMAQIFSSLPMRQWPIPLAAVFAIIGVPLGLFKDIGSGNLDELLPFVFFMSIWIGLAVLMAVLFTERYRRGHLIIELRKAKEDLERYAAQAEELAALRERTRLAREMHDSLGHALVVVNVKLEAAQRLYAVERARGDAELEATRVLVRETMAELRRSLANLRAPLPDHQDLGAALRRLAEEIQTRSSIDITCATAPDLPTLAPETTESLWRVAREALTNVERHAAAGSAAVALERQNGTLILRIADDGSGVTPADLARPGHYGVTGMCERITALGGTLRVARRAEGGTVVEAQVPLSVSEDAVHETSRTHPAL